MKEVLVWLFVAALALGVEGYSVTGNQIFDAYGNPILLRGNKRNKKRKERKEKKEKRRKKRRKKKKKRKKKREKEKCCSSTWR